MSYHLIKLVTSNLSPEKNRKGALWEYVVRTCTIISMKRSMYIILAHKHSRLHGKIDFRIITTPHFDVMKTNLDEDSH